jgi:hypothetical protein
LVELMIAMTVTLVVTGAVYGVMAGSNNAFRREPELTDRQQNARIAMDMIQMDIATAGVNMGPFFQSFSRNLNGAGRITGPSGQVADHLEIFGNTGTCPDAPATPTNPTSGSNFNARGPIPDCYSEESLVLVVYSNGGAKWGLGHNIHAQNFKLNFPPGQQPDGSQINSPQDLASYAAGNGTPVALSPLELIRYEIAMDPPGSTTAQGGVPSLYRSATGGRSPGDGTFYAPTSAANVASGRWQVLARGVEDLQIQYRNGTGVWADDPGAVMCSGTCAAPTAVEYNRGVREVRATVTVRAEGHNLQGQTAGTPAGEGSRANAVRGNVTTVSSVKALQRYLSEVGPTPACLECPVWR